MCASVNDSSTSQDSRQDAGTYRLNTLGNDKWLLVRTDGRAIGADERDLIIAAAQNAVRFSLNEALEQNTDTIAKTALWHFPTKRTDLFGVGDGGCVYFATDKAYPGLVKIGLTTKNVIRRISGLRFSHDCIAPQAVACAVTPAYQQFEAGLHLKFQGFRRLGEWFELEPIMAYINQFRVDGAA